jgi:hypothetical protein
MGFAYYASFVRLVLTGGYSFVLLERARAFVLNAALKNEIES